MIDEGESCRECAVRELFEETNQKAERICFNGLMKFNLLNGKTEYGALYSAGILETGELTKNDANFEIAYWNGKDDFHNINEIDKTLLDYYKEP